MSYFRSILYPLAALLAAGTVISCSLANYPDIERGSGYTFQDGQPEVRMSAWGIVDEQQDGVVHVTADVVDASLIYEEQGGQNVARINIEVRLVGTDNEYSDSYGESLTVGRDYEGYITSRELIRFDRQMSAPPGRYEVHVSVTDQSLGKQTVRSAEAFVPDPDPDGQGLHLSSVQLLSRPAGSGQAYRPVTTYDVSVAHDSIRFRVQVVNNLSDDPPTLTSRLIRFRSDTDPARPMVYNNYATSTTAYKGIEYNDREILEESRRQLDQPGSLIIEYRYPLPERGNYRFQVQLGEAVDDHLFKARDFGIKSPNYPMVKTARELAEPLIYLMDRREHEQLTAIEDPDSLKTAIDRFWLSNIGSMSQARQVISLYYERVVEANKQFANFKEGWKTDMGMIYILFGPPWYTKRHYGGYIWSYTYDIANPEYHFRFIRPTTRREPSFPFHHYVLAREQGNFNIQSRQVRLWLNGNIMNHPLGYNTHETDRFRLAQALSQSQY